MKLKKFALMFFVPLGVAITGVSVLSSKSRVIRAEDVARLKAAAWLRYEAPQITGTNLPVFPADWAPSPMLSVLPIDTNLVGNGTISANDFLSVADRAILRAYGYLYDSIIWISDENAAKVISGNVIVSAVGSYVLTNTDVPGSCWKYGSCWKFNGFGSELIPGYGSRATDSNYFRGFLVVNAAGDVYRYDETDFTNAALANRVWYLDESISREKRFPSISRPSWPESAGPIAYCYTNFFMIDPTGAVHCSRRVIEKSILSRLSDTLTNVNYTFAQVDRTDHAVWGVDCLPTDCCTWVIKQYSEKTVSTNLVLFPPFQNPQKTVSSVSTNVGDALPTPSVTCGIWAYAIDRNDAAWALTGLKDYSRWEQSISVVLPRKVTLWHPSIWAVTNGLVKSITLLGTTQLSVPSGACLPEDMEGEPGVSYAYMGVWKPSTIASLLPVNVQSRLDLPDDSIVPSGFRYNLECGVSNTLNFFVNGCHAHVIRSIENPSTPEDLEVSFQDSDFSYPDRWISLDHMMSESHLDISDVGAPDKYYRTDLEYTVYDHLYVLVEWVNPFDWIDSHVSTNSVSQ